MNKEFFEAILVSIMAMTIFALFDKHYIHARISNITEPYDMVIPDITHVECGNKCTYESICASFAYDILESKCYISNTPILGKPHESLYTDTYSKLDKQ